MPKYIIGRSYNKHGVADYYGGNDDVHHAFFCGKGAAHIFTNQNVAFGMTIRLKRLLPTIMGGSPATYSIIELQS